jgi:hypothetical protein
MRTPRPVVVETTRFCLSIDRARRENGLVARQFRRHQATNDSSYETPPIGQSCAPTDLSTPITWAGPLRLFFDSHSLSGEHVIRLTPRLKIRYGLARVLCAFLPQLAAELVVFLGPRIRLSIGSLPE